MSRSAIVGLVGLALFGLDRSVLAGPVPQPGAAPPAFILVDRQRQAVIVQGETKDGAVSGWKWVGANPPTAVTANGGGLLLQKYVEQSTGRKLALIPESQYDAVAAPYAVFVGNSSKAQELFGDKLRNLDWDGYIVHVSPSRVVLAGNVEYAESDFLRRYLGIDSYLPTKLFTIVPKHDEVTIPVETRIELPVFLSRAFSSLRTSHGDYGQPDIPWRLHAGSGRYLFHHNIQNIVGGPELERDHPEFFALIGGRRNVPPSQPMPFPCVSNPSLVRLVIDRCRAFFSKNPLALSISLAADDTGQWCDCPSCRAMDGPSIRLAGISSRRSNRCYGFLNQVARAIRENPVGGPAPAAAVPPSSRWTLRQRYIGTLAYWGTELPPSFPVERNIVPYICDSRAGWADPDQKAASLARIDAWLERVDRIGIYEYYYGGGFSVPRLYTRQLAELLRHVGRKRRGCGFYAEIYSNHGLDGPKAWVTEKLLWNPDQDVDLLMRQWASACFGPAAVQMKRYFDLIEETWAKRTAEVEPNGMTWGYKDEAQFEMWKPEDVAALRTLLEKARARAGEDEAALERIDYLGSTFEITDTLVRQFHAHAETARLVKNQARAAAVLGALLKGDRDWVDLSPWNLIMTKQGDGTSFLGSVLPSRAVRAVEYVFENGPWTTVGGRLSAGERDPRNLVRAAQDVLLQMAPAGYGREPRAKARMDQLLRLAERIVVAPRTVTPPKIDGNPDEPCWRWVDQPWFIRTTGSPFPLRTSFAWAYDDESLYLALRCRDQDIPASLPKKNGTVEVFVNPDGRDADPSAAPSVHLVVTAYGELSGPSKDAVIRFKVSNDGKETWQAEIAMSWKRLGVDPHRYPYLRLNLMRSPTGRGSTGTGLWFVGYEVPRKTQLPDAASRGWLVLGP
jgi:hypothetical protein